MSVSKAPADGTWVLWEDNVLARFGGIPVAWMLSTGVCSLSSLPLCRLTDVSADL